MENKYKKGLIIKMEKNKILDYEQVEEKLAKIVAGSAGMIRQQEDLAVTKYGFPIRYYTIGNGKKEIVITGATHGAEIVSTDFVLKLMEEMTKNDGVFNGVDLEEYTFHIVPMLNPEGYIVATSAIRTLIPRDMSTEDAEKICKEYYMAYRNDDQEALARKKAELEPDRISIKHHQEMFRHADWTCIPEQYEGLRQSIRKIYEKYPDLPKGSMIMWSANGDGIDIQANCAYNSAIGKIENDEHVYKDALRYSNIDTSHPGPINCPMNKEIGFSQTIETKAISDLLQVLHEKGTLVGYENFHSTGGLIYQRPCKNGNGFEISQDLYWERIVNNVFKAMSYREGTYKNANDKENSQYKVLKGSALPNSTNDIFRMKYPADLLIELSGMGGNPIGPYGDIVGNYTNIINSNIAAYSDFLRYYSIIEKLSQGAYNAFRYMMKEHNSQPDEELKEEHITGKYGVYEIAEIMMQEAMRYIRAGKIEELEDLLTRGYFAKDYQYDESGRKIPDAEEQDR